MSHPQNRRRFLTQVAQTGTFVGSLSLPALSALGPLQAADTAIAPDVVQFHPEIEALVRLIEETPRQELLEQMGRRVKSGLSYREVLAALFLAGIRNVQPRPSVGFKFHAVLVVNSAHIASQSGPDSDRWLPIFWALDEFKSSQARDVREGNWTMPAVKDSAVPDAEHVRPAFQTAMDTWDEEKADGAAAGLARYVGATEVLEWFARYAARDFRSIGHKAIYVANAWRTLQTIGWHHAEPVLRSLAYALLNHNGEPNPAKNQLSPDEPWRQNQAQAAAIRPNWLSGKLDAKATTELLQVLRTESAEQSAAAVVGMVNAGVSPGSIFDALHVGAGELLMRQPGIVALHAVTSTNAIRFLFDATGDDQTRRLLMLQNASFLPLFREAMKGRGAVKDTTVETLTASAANESAADSLHGVFDAIRPNPDEAANRILSYLESGYSPQDLLTGARRLIFLKGTNAHDYKFSSAVLEDFYNVSPAWRNRFLATAAFNLRGSNDSDNGLVNRIQSAVG